MNRTMIAPGVVIIGMALMVVGVATTYVALGQDAAPEATEEAVAPVPTITPTVVVKTDEAQEAQTPKQQSQSDGGQQQKGATRREEAPGQRREQSAQTVPTQVDTPVVEATPQMRSENEAEAAVSPGDGRGRDDAPGQNKADTGSGEAGKASQVGETQSGRANQADGASPAAAGQPGNGNRPAVELPETAVADEAALEPEAVGQNVILAPAEAGIVSGRVGSQGRVSVTLTLPTGEIVSRAADEQGLFQFEVMEPGEYRLVASAPGALSRQITFNLNAGQQLELPPTSLSLGDVNQDSRIDLNDIVLIAANYDGPALVVQADLNGDSWIDISDLTMIGAKFGLVGPLPWESP